MKLALPTSPRVPRLAITLISASALAYEILLMRLFTITQWHHFAYMIISLALLGYGASGTFLALTQSRLLSRFPRAFISNLLLFGITILVGYVAAQHISFNAEALLWDLHQPLKLLAIYLLLLLPFFFAANAIALALAHFRDDIARVYAADLFGGGIGSIAIVVLLFVLFPGQALQLISSLGLLAAVIASRELYDTAKQPKHNWKTLLLSVAALFPLALPAIWFKPVISPYKELSQTLQISGTHIVKERSSPLGLLSVAQSPIIPFRYAPGISITATTEPPEQYGVFTDGDAMTVITRNEGEREKLNYLDQLTSALPYHLASPEQVLIPGAGGGSEVLQARYHSVPHIDAVELNPQMITLVRQDYADLAGHLYDSPDVTLHLDEARGFVAGSRAHYDLIQLAMLDSFSASSAGLYALSENYLYTVEGIQQYLKHLNSGGYLVLSRWIKLPPRDTLKLLATGIEALKKSGVNTPGQQLMLIRGWQTATLLIKNGPITEKEISALHDFCSARAFDIAYYPGITENEVNRYNILRQPYFYKAALALLGNESKSFINDYKFDLRPATDDRPYFFKFFKWQTLPEILSLRGKGGMPLLESGYLVLIATLLQAALVSMVLILLPLWVSRHHSLQVKTGVSRSKVLVYFFAIGLAFLFLEIAFIQKFILFLSHPLYAVMVVLSGFLVFAGLGSAWSRRLQERHGSHRAAVIAVSTISLVGLLYLVLLTPLFGSLMSLPDTVKITLSIILIAPLAFFMGMPFPMALTVLGEKAPTLIPWAWAVNGCASVLSAVLATLLAIHFGFTVVVLLALLLYGIAAVAFPKHQNRAL